MLGKFNGVLLAADYDETLYGAATGISSEDQAAIRAFIAQGGCFTVATGRSFRNFSIQMQREDIPVNVPVILSNGANLYDYRQGCLLFEGLLRPQVVEDMARVVAEFPALGFEAYCREMVYVHNPNEVTVRHLGRAGLEGLPTPILEMPVPWTKAILQQTDTGLLRTVRAYMEVAFGAHYEVIFSNPVLLELTAKGIHKGSAVLRLAEHLGIAREHIYCVGNGENDLPMLEISAVPFAPENCAPILRDFGATILPPVGESCIAELLRRLEARYGGTVIE